VALALLAGYKDAKEPELAEGQPGLVGTGAGVADAAKPSTAGSSASAAKPCVASSLAAASRFSGPRRGRNPPDPDRDTKLDRIEEVLDRFPERWFAFDEFGPLGIRPTAGAGWAQQGHPQRLPVTYRRTHGVRYFHGCYSVGDDRLWGVNRRRKGTASRRYSNRARASASGTNKPDAADPARRSALLPDRRRIRI
jgi:hypothetical protein